MGSGPAGELPGAGPTPARGVMGSRLARKPVASKKALARAPPTATIGGSPDPFGASVAFGTMTVSRRGIQEKSGMSVLVEIEVGDGGRLEMKLLAERIAQAHHQAAFHLLANAVGVDDPAAILS